MRNKRSLTSRRAISPTRKKKRLSGIEPPELNTQNVITDASSTFSDTTRMLIPRRVSCDDCQIQETTQQTNKTDSVETIDAIDGRSPISIWDEHDGASSTGIARDVPPCQNQRPEEMATHPLESIKGDFISLDRSTQSLPEEVPFIVVETIETNIKKNNVVIHHQQRKPSRRIRTWFGLVVLFLGVILKAGATCFRSFEMPHFITQQEIVERDAVCVSGGGFSGFWYIIGRLQSIPDPLQKNYYCYSAGCLGIVASFLDIAMEDVHKMAVDIQEKWNKGEITRYEVLTMFVDDLIHHMSNGTIAQDDFAFLNRLNILTTVRDGWFSLKTSTRTPTSVQSLRTLLIQTAWIPFATGDRLFYRGHMDGAFFLAGHPRCESTIGLPANIDIVANIVNMNLSAKKVQHFWKLGGERGL